MFPCRRTQFIVYKRIRTSYLSKEKHGLAVLMNGTKCLCNWSEDHLHDAIRIGITLHLDFFIPKKPESWCTGFPKTPQWNPLTGYKLLLKADTAKCFSCETFESIFPPVLISSTYAVLGNATDYHLKQFTVFLIFPRYHASFSLGHIYLPILSGNSNFLEHYTVSVLNK